MQAKLDYLIKHHAIVIVQFGSESCNPCLALKTKIADYISLNPELKYLYIDAKENLLMASQMNVMTVPTIIVYIHGKEVIKRSGYFSLDELLNKLEEYRTYL